MEPGHIARAFQDGDFEIPIFAHDTGPTSMLKMKPLQNQVTYSFEGSAGGGRVIVSSAERDAIAAIHNFLPLQVKEHESGDPREVR
jgi:hypothetical protein